MAFLKSIWKANSKHHKSCFFLLGLAYQKDRLHAYKDYLRQNYHPHFIIGYSIYLLLFLFFYIIELSEELALQNNKDNETDQQNEKIENEDDVIIFKLKYLGSTVVETNIGENVNTDAVKNIIKVAKAGRKKLQRVHIAVSLKGIAVTDLEGNDLFKVSIYRISNCSTDPTHRQVFSFISTDVNETMECYAFICPKRKMAETVTLAVAHAFSTAYEAWRILPSTKQTVDNFANHSTPSLFLNKQEVNSKFNFDSAERSGSSSSSHSHSSSNQLEKASSPINIEEKLIDFDDDDATESSVTDFIFDFDKSPNTFNSHWVCFDDDFVPNARKDFKTDLIMA